MIRVGLCGLPEVCVRDGLHIHDTSWPPRKTAMAGTCGADRDRRRAVVSRREWSNRREPSKVTGPAAAASGLR